MSRLTPFARLLIVLLIVGGIFFGAKKFFPELGSKTEMPTLNKGTETSGGDNETSSMPSSSSNAPSPSNSSSSSSGDSKPSGPPVSKAKFEYTPDAPVNGKLKGVVELGATGFNSFIINVDKQKNWKLEKADFGASLVYEKLTTDQDVKDGLKKYIADMLAYGVSPREIHFVISSGAQKVDIAKKIIDYLKGMGYVVNLVTASQEGTLGYKSVMPKDYTGDAFVVDIGSGNTKIAWMDGGSIKNAEAAGAKYFQNNTSDESVYADVKAKANQIPPALRKTCFIIGGVPFDLAKQVRNGKERFTILAAPDKYTPKDAKGKAGINIYKAIADATDCQQFVFDWDANFTIGFLLGLGN
jgi:hypothetical protein